MKKISTFLASALFSLSLLAYDGTRLSVTSVSNTRLRMEVDGRRYNLGVNNDVMIRDLAPGYHTIRIIKENSRFNNDRDDRGWNIFGRNRNNNRQEIVYNQSLYIRDGFHYDITVTRFGKVMLDERRMDRNDQWFEENCDDDRTGNGGWGNGNGNGNGGNSGGWGNGNGNGFMRPMDQRDFIRAKETIERESFDNSKLVIAKQVIDNNYFSSEQAKQLAQVFSFDSYKLDLAKYIYRNTTDKGNFFILYDVFSFSSYKEDLAKYIREYR